MEYRVVAANQISADVTTLSAWLNDQSADGWTLIAADHGMLFLSRFVKDKADE